MYGETNLKLGIHGLLQAHTHSDAEHSRQYFVPKHTHARIPLLVDIYIYRVIATSMRYTAIFFLAAF